MHGICKGTGCPVEGMLKYDMILRHYERQEGFPKKSSKVSERIRAEGNKLYSKKSHYEELHKMIISLYTQSIAYAEENSEEQALAYGNRSAVLLHLKKYKKCLVDISRACKITQSSALKKKLEDRREKCLTEMKKDDEDNSKNFYHFNCHQKNQMEVNKNWFKKLVEEELDYSVSDEVLEEIKWMKNSDFNEIQFKYKKLKLPTLETPNEMIPIFSECITLKNDKKNGNHVVATRDIKPGEILSIENGFACPDMEKIYIYCSYCLNFMWNGIPCLNCVNAVYCSEKCKMKAWQEYHDIECSLLPVLFSDILKIQNLGSEVLAYRMFIIFVKNEGLKNMLEQVKSMLNNKNTTINGLLTNGKFDESKFKTYYNLPKHKDHSEHFNQEFGALSAMILSKYTEILKDNNIYHDEYEDLDSLEDVQKLIIRLNSVIGGNACRFQFKNDSFVCCKHLYEDAESKTTGLMLTAGSSFFKHSCSPNVFSVFCENGKRITISKKPIKKNEQILYNDGEDLNTPKKEGQALLKQKFNLTCECEAFKNNWNRCKNFEEELFTRKLSDIFKIMKELNEFKQKTKSQKIDNLTLIQSIKCIELVYKYFNDEEATFICNYSMEYMEKVFRKFYSFEIDMPLEC